MSAAVSDSIQGISVTRDYAASLYGSHDLGNFWLSVTRTMRGGGTQSTFVPADDNQGIADAVAHYDSLADTTGVFLSQTLAAKNFVWRDLVSEFVASDAFRSAPAAVITAGNQ